ncbi:jg3938 [Pararge aegeria aegeria]|uniref:Jg3938 protein n=1 Tax=Pararge aegeria aegeria TaxID=348720 RepID=A0A8S4RVX0_9NEOP|nr:jg3938 [Pararge aegeria aegeria]
MITGHCPLNKHISILGITDSPLCRECKDDETPIHREATPLDILPTTILANQLRRLGQKQKKEEEAGLIQRGAIPAVTRPTDDFGQPSTEAGADTEEEGTDRKVTKYKMNLSRYVTIDWAWESNTIPPRHKRRFYLNSFAFDYAPAAGCLSIDYDGESSWFG